jgi:predicted phospho-2-dehydro-3-deoxyheptonate aldolase
MLGKDIRLKRLYRHSNRLFIVPMDHGITLGPVEGLTDIRQTVSSVFAGGADAVVVHKGLVRYMHEGTTPLQGEIIVHLSASTVMAPDANRKEIVSSVENAVRLGATAVSTHVNLGAPHEAEMLRDMGRVADECSYWGMPLLAMMYVRDGNKENEYCPDKIKHAARVAEELGADLVKVNYTGSRETFAEVVKGVKIPVLIAGGPRLDSEEALLRMIEDAVEAGASGVSIGRNVFQHPQSMQLAQTIRKILDQSAGNGATWERR